MSEVWREDILNHLASCSILLAVCTSNYECSAWGNQEVGIALEKKKENRKERVWVLGIKIQFLTPN